MRLNSSKYIALAAAFLLMMAGANSANAERREARGRLVSKAEVKAIIGRVENRLDAFVKNFDRSLDRSRLNGTNREDWLNKRAKDLEKATDDLRQRFGRTEAWAENRAEVTRCLEIAADIDKNVRNNRYGRVTESNWSRVRFELNTLADVYNMPGVGAR